MTQAESDEVCVLDAGTQAQPWRRARFVRVCTWAILAVRAAVTQWAASRQKRKMRGRAQDGAGRGIGESGQRKKAPLSLVGAITEAPTSQRKLDLSRTAAPYARYAQGAHHPLRQRLGLGTREAPVGIVAAQLVDGKRIATKMEDTAAVKSQDFPSLLHLQPTPRQKADRPTILSFFLHHSALI